MSKGVILAGAGPDTANLGVNALCRSAVANLLAQDPHMAITILDHGDALRPGGYFVGDGLRCDLMGAKHTKRVHKSSAYLNINLSRLLPFYNSVQKSRFKQAAAVLDISGGDSFTDLYGQRRFETVAYPKRLAMAYKVPLILLPQTYGPFENDANKARAAALLRYATMAFARDQYSFEVMRELLADKFDERRHHQAVDVAFILPATPVAELQGKHLLPPRQADKEVFGINISGLIYQNPAAAKDVYGISVDYNALVERVIVNLLTQSDGDVWLVPHVLAPRGHYESDVDACSALKARLSPAHQARVYIVDGHYDECDIKGVIGQCDWFCGTRMHSTIAALSSGVPTLGFAYSGKFKGVFETAGQGHSVVDARADDGEFMFENIMQSWLRRVATKGELAGAIPAVRARAEQQMRAIAEFVQV